VVTTLQLGRPQAYRVGRSEGDSQLWSTLSQAWTSVESNFLPSSEAKREFRGQAETVNRASRGSRAGRGRVREGPHREGPPPRSSTLTSLAEPRGRRFEACGARRKQLEESRPAAEASTSTAQSIARLPIQQSAKRLQRCLASGNEKEMTRMSCPAERPASVNLVERTSHAQPCHFPTHVLIFWRMTL
jgi:hypothetical protein